MEKLSKHSNQEPGKKTNKINQKKVERRLKAKINQTGKQDKIKTVDLISKTEKLIF